MPITSHTPPGRGRGPRTRRTARATLPTALAALLVAACQWGTRPLGFPPALGPQGASVILVLGGPRSEMRGELFAVDSSGVIVRGPRLARVAWPRVDQLYVEKLGGDYSVTRRESPPAEATRARLARVSRFPQGLRGPLLTRVLAILQQPALEEIR